MANNYTQLYVQIVFAVKYRQSVIRENFRDELEKYISGIISNNKCKPLAIYCNPDHTHILLGLHPTISISELTGDIKANSSKFLNKSGKVEGNFAWQDGFGAFTYSRSQINQVAKYIFNQPEHHKKESFREEYLEILEKSEIEYDERYLFEFFK